MVQLRFVGCEEAVWFLAGRGHEAPLGLDGDVVVAVELHDALRLAARAPAGREGAGHGLGSRARSVTTLRLLLTLTSLGEGVTDWLVCLPPTIFRVRLYSYTLYIFLTGILRLYHG